MASRRRRPSQSQRSRNEGPGDPGLSKNTEDKPEPNNDPQLRNHPSRKSPKDSFQEQSGHFKKSVEQSSRHRRKDSTSGTWADKELKHTGALKPSQRVPQKLISRERAEESKGNKNALKPGPGVPPRQDINKPGPKAQPRLLSRDRAGESKGRHGTLKSGPRDPPKQLNKDRAGQGQRQDPLKSNTGSSTKPLNMGRARERQRHQDSKSVKDNVPRLTVVNKDSDQTDDKTSIQLPSVGESNCVNAKPTYSKTERHHNLPTENVEDPSTSERESFSRARGGFESKSLPSTLNNANNEEAKREPLRARETNISKIIIGDSSKSRISPRRAKADQLQLGFQGLIAHQAAHENNFTPQLIAHQAAHETNFTPQLIAHQAAHETNFTPQLIPHQAAHETNFTPQLIAHQAAHETNFTPQLIAHQAAHETNF